MSLYVQAWLRSFLFTQLVEVPIYMQALPGNRWRAGFISFGASALTHPVVWFVFPVLVHRSWIRMTTLAELFAFGVEAIYMSVWLKPWRAVWVSLVANGASF